MRRRRKPAELTMPPQFVDTPAQNAGCVVEDIREPGKATRRRRTRETELLRLAKSGRISDEQCAAGLRLRDLWDETQRTPAPQEPVDRTARPDDATVHRVTAMTEFAKAMRAVNGETVVQAVRHVCCHDRSLRDGLARNGVETMVYMDSLLLGLRSLERHFGVR